MPLLAQITLWQDPNTGLTHAEIPAGSLRKKIPLPKNPQEWGEILSGELQEISAWIKNENQRKKELQVREERDRALKEDREFWNRRRKNFDDCASYAGLEFANEKIGQRSKVKPYVPRITKILSNGKGNQ